ncbi:MAG: dual specificity protein phosphatase [archaeon]|nr:dual specificity protein phosphatase [archaeon]
MESANKLEVLNNLGVRHIVCAAAELTPTFPGQFSYQHVAVDDTPRDDILSHFSEVFSALHGAFLRSEPVLIHCAMGISRSSTLTLMYLIRAHGYDVDSAFRLLKDRRPFVQPNTGFTKQLQSWHSFSNPTSTSS